MQATPTTEPGPPSFTTIRITAIPTVITLMVITVGSTTTAVDTVGMAIMTTIGMEAATAGAAAMVTGTTIDTNFVCCVRMRG